MGKDDFIQDYYNRCQDYCKKRTRLNSIHLKQKAAVLLALWWSVKSTPPGEQPPVFADWYLWKSGSCPPSEMGRRGSGAVFPDDGSFPKDGPRLRKTLLGYESGEAEIYISKGRGKKFIIQCFFK